jgi:hypothetical protein
MDFHASLDPGSLEELVRLQGFASLLNPEITQGLTEAGTLLTNAAVANTWSVFDRPSGALANSIYPYVISPTEVAVAVGVPYGQRREKGFSGMTDALGRHYVNDPAKPYLQPAVDDHQQEVAEIMEMAVNTALGRVAG